MFVWRREKGDWERSARVLAREMAALNCPQGWAVCYEELPWATGGPNERKLLLYYEIGKGRVAFTLAGVAAVMATPDEPERAPPRVQKRKLCGELQMQHDIDHDDGTPDMYTCDDAQTALFDAFRDAHHAARTARANYLGYWIRFDRGGDRESELTKRCFEMTAVSHTRLCCTRMHVSCMLCR